MRNLWIKSGDGQKIDQRKEEGVRNEVKRCQQTGKGANGVFRAVKKTEGKTIEHRRACIDPVG